MRMIGRGLLAMLTLLLIVQAWNAGAPLWWDLHWRGVAVPSGARAVRSYVLPQDRYLRFRIPAQAQSVHVMIAAGWRSTAAAPTPVSIVWQRRDRQSRLLDEGSVDLTFVPVKNSEQKWGSAWSSTRYLEVNGIAPLGDKDGFFDSDPQQPARWLYLRWRGTHPELEFVSARVNYRVYHDPREAELLWQRLSPERQDDLTASAILPRELMSSTEKIALMSATVEPLAPEGIAGREYEEKRLYAFDQIPIGVKNASLAQGLYVDANKSASLPLHASGAGAQQTLKIRRLADRGAHIAWQFYPEHAQQPDSGIWTLDAAETFRALPRRSGLLVLRSDAPVDILQQNAQQQSSAPEKMLRPLLHMNAGSRLEYRIDHHGNDATPIAVAVFGVNNAPKLRLKLLRADGGVYQEAPLRAAAEGDPFARLLPLDPAQNLSSAGRWFGLAPAGVTRLQIVSAEESWVAVSTRPPRLRLSRSVPGESRPWLFATPPQPIWFSLRPIGLNDVEWLQQKQLAHWFYPPPSLPDPSLQWVSVAPRGTAQGLRLYSGLDAGTDSRALTASAAIYSPVGSDQIVDVQANSGRNLLTTELFYVRESEKLARLSVQWDEQSPLLLSVASRSGHLRLPPIAAGRHRLRLQGIDAQFWLNHLPPQATSLVVRTAYPVGSALQFDVQKRGLEDALSLRVWCPQGRPLQIDTDLAAPLQMPSDGYTPRARHFSGNPAMAMRAYSEFRQHIDWAAFDVLSLPLDHDIPAAPISLQVRSKTADCYVALAHPQSTDLDHRWFREQRDASF